MSEQTCCDKNMGEPFTCRQLRDEVQHLMADLSQLAEAVLQAHCEHYPKAYHVGCPVCQTARKYKEVE